MAMMSLWNRQKNDDYRFIDDQIREMFRVGGVEVLLHKYLGIHDQGEQNDATQPSNSKSRKKKVSQIQDLFFLENRDRAYDTTIYELRGSYQVQDLGFSMGNFAAFLDGDTMFLEFHINDILEKIDRKLMIGDVLEFPHLRDDAMLDGSLAANKYYVVDDVTKAAGGWSQVWRSHMFRVKLKPLTDSQEYRDILDRKARDIYGDEQEFDVRSLISDFRDVMGSGGISDAIIKQAEADVPMRNFETAHFYVVPGDEMGKQYPWIFAGDGKPPNGAELAGQGTSFPENAKDGDWFLHTGVDPYILYQFTGNTIPGPTGQPMASTGGAWHRREVDLRKKWQAAHRIMNSFINNDNVNEINGQMVKEKIAISKAVRPKADL
jgi:hypothetical protein